MRTLALTSLLAIWIGGCGVEAEDPGQPGQQSFRVSPCGGFTASLAQKRAPSYCDAEVLEWTYAKGTLKLLDKRVVLNCCGNHSVKITQENGTTVITEVDAPQGALAASACASMTSR